MFREMQDMPRTPDFADSPPPDQCGEGAGCLLISRVIRGHLTKLPPWLILAAVARAAPHSDTTQLASPDLLFLITQTITAATPEYFSSRLHWFLVSYLRHSLVVAAARPSIR